jgi:hypothetical protein
MSYATPQSGAVLTGFKQIFIAIHFFLFLPFAFLLLNTVSQGANILLTPNPEAFLELTSRNSPWILCLDTPIK